jgi:hypothetical protein
VCSGLTVCPAPPGEAAGHLVDAESGGWESMMAVRSDDRGHAWLVCGMSLSRKSCGHRSISPRAGAPALL